MSLAAAGSTLADSLSVTALHKMAREPNGAWKVAKFLGIPFESVIEGTTRIGNAIEETTKMLGYKRGARVEKLSSLTGEARVKALDKIAYEVRNYAGSPDFAKHGAVPEINLLSMFYNARMQGISADLRRLSGRTGTKEAVSSMLKLTATVGLPTAYVWFNNQKQENVDDYNKRTSQEKENYWLLPRYLPNGAGRYIMNDKGERVREYWRIPKADIMQQVANMVEGGLDFGKSKNPKDLVAAGVSALENLSPLSISGKNIGEMAESTVSGLNPILKAPLEMMFNRDTFHHQPIVPDKMTAASPWEQYKDKTNPAFRTAAGAVTKAVSTVTDDPGSTLARLQSPLHLQQLTNNLTGSMLTQFIRPEQEGRDPLASHPILGRFFGSPTVDHSDDYNLISKLRTTDTDQNLLQSRAIDQFLKQAPMMEPRERINSLIQIVQADPVNNLQAVFRAMGDNAAGTNDVDKSVRSLSSEGAAQFIKKKADAITDPEAQRQYYLEMYKRKVLTPTVGMELLKLRKLDQGKPK